MPISQKFSRFDGLGGSSRFTRQSITKTQVSGDFANVNSGSLNTITKCAFFGGNTSVNVIGTYKQVETIYVKLGSTWLPVTNVFINISGSWRRVET